MMLVDEMYFGNEVWILVMVGPLTEKSGKTIFHSLREQEIHQSVFSILILRENQSQII